MENPKQIIKRLFDLIYDFEKQSFDKKVSIVKIDYKNYQILSSYDKYGEYINYDKQSILGIPFIIKTDIQDIEVG